jgi:hypothetical protein
VPAQGPLDNQASTVADHLGAFEGKIGEGGAERRDDTPHVGTRDGATRRRVFVRPARGKRDRDSGRIVGVSSVEVRVDERSVLGEASGHARAPVW